MSQIILPFQNLIVPSKHLEWFKLANAGEYYEKKLWFYPFKTRFLKAHGVSDGQDLQVIVQKCWCGDGIWRGRDDELPPDLHESCFKCAGTGIYDTKRIMLNRWLISGHLFHEPAGLIFRTDTHEFKETFNGPISHPSVPESVAMRAMERLLLRYEPNNFYALWMNRWRQWKEGKQRNVKYRIRRVRMLLSFRQESDVPF